VKIFARRPDSRDGPCHAHGSEGRRPKPVATNAALAMGILMAGKDESGAILQ